MASDSRNQVQQARVRIRALRWTTLFELLGVSPEVAKRPDVRKAMQEVEEMSWTIRINEGW